MIHEYKRPVDRAADLLIGITIDETLSFDETKIHACCRRLAERLEDGETITSDMGETYVQSGYGTVFSIGFRVRGLPVIGTRQRAITILRQMASDPITLH